MAKKQIPPQAPDYIIDLPSSAPSKYKDYLGAYESWVYTATTAIAQEVANLELKLYKKTIRNREVQYEELLEHEALSILEYTNDFMTQFQLFEITQTYMELLGEGYIAKLRGAGNKVEELWHLRPDWVKVIKSDENFIAGYRYSPNNNPKVFIDFPIEDIIPFKNFNPKDAYRGMGTVKAGAMAIDIDTYSAEWVRNFFYNSALPSLVFTTDKRLKDEDAKRFLEQWHGKFRGRQNAHKVAFLGGGLKPEVLNKDPNQMQFLEQRKAMRDEILAMFRVPLSIIGISEDVNRANADATIRSFMQNVIKPRMKRMVTYLNEFYLTEWADENIFFDFVDPTPDDRDMELRVYESGLQNGWLTINEVREMENREAVDGGDTIYLPFNLQPVSVTGKLANFFGGKKAEMETGMLALKKTGDKKHKFNVQVPHKKLREFREESLKKDLKHDFKKLVMKIIEESQDGESTFTRDKKEAYWKQLVAKTDVQEERFEQTLVKLFVDQKQEVLANLQAIKYYRKDIRKDKVTEILFDEDRADDLFMSTIQPIIRNFVTERAREAFEFLGLKQDLNMNSDAVIDFINKQTGDMIKGINDTTKQKLRDQLVTGLQNNESIPELSERIENVYSDATSYRADMIARTEVLRANNFGSVEAYEQSGVVSGKEWLTALDERVHEGCAELDGTIVPLKSKFKTENGFLDQPPLHPNCRCTTIPVVSSKRILDTVDKKKNKQIDVDKVAKKLVQEMEKEEHEERIQELNKKTEEATVKANEILADATVKSATLKKQEIEKGKQEAQKIVEEAEQERQSLYEKAKGEIADLKQKAINLFK